MSLHTKYRPKTFEDVIGQVAVVKALRSAVKRAEAHTYLLSGPSGTGKTTLARIVARELGCAPSDIMEIDAATNTGVDAMRDTLEMARHRPFGEGLGRAVIVDEAHGLSKNAWDALLKLTEEPPAHLYWFFCTTQIMKVPATMKTRCLSFVLKPLSEDQLWTLFDQVCKWEKFKVEDVVASLIVRRADGSPRQLLVNLAKCHDTTSKREAADLLDAAVTSQPVLELCRFVTAGKGSWVRAMGFIEDMGEENWEGVRIQVCAYLGKVLRGTTSEKAVVPLVRKLEAFSEPYNQAEGIAPLMLSIARVLYAS